MNRILSITALGDSVVFLTQLPVESTAQVCEAATNADPEAAGTPVMHRVLPGDGRRLEVPRFRDGYDRVYSRFTIAYDGVTLPGPRYVGAFEAPAWDYPYPTASTIKGLQVHMIDDAVTVGVRHVALNISQPTVMLAQAGPNALPFESGGRTYFFRRDYIEGFDEQVRTLSSRGIVVNLILLNSMHWDGITASSDVEARLSHPDFDREGFISAFNTVTDEGVAHYIAFVEFLAQRYMRADARFGRACGFIIGNEVDSQWVWCNAGRKTVEAYTAQYAVALRLAWLASAKYYTHARAYVSLDHFWTLRYLGDEAKPYDPLQTYAGRDILDNLTALGERDGNFPWALAHHPYPENLENPDFWNDKTATCSMDAGRVTFKNLEVLCAYMHQPRLQYAGRPRPIILSEQGFNSGETEESERLQAAAYALAYRKVETLPQIEAFILHAHVDNRDEFGLNLGIRRRDKSSEDGNTPGEPKPVYDVFRAIDTAEGERYCREARETIGAQIWDDILAVKEC